MKDESFSVKKNIKMDYETKEVNAVTHEQASSRDNDGLFFRFLFLDFSQKQNIFCY